MIFRLQFLSLFLFTILLSIILLLPASCALSACSPKCVIGSQVDGLFTGVHIGVASYNYALKNSTYRYQNSDTGTPLLNMGLTAGYRLSLGKGGCWCLEFSLGAGYAYLDYDRFFNIPGGAYVDTRHKNFFGIDHAGISVGYRIDWKGGRR